MSEEPTHGSTTIHASKDGGGAGKWLIGAAAAAVLVGGGYFAWKSMSPGQPNVETAYNEPYAEDPLRAGPLEPDQDALAEGAASDESAAPPASAEPRRAAPARRSAARAEAVPEATIGITPVNATSEDVAPQDGDDIVVTAPRRPTWARTPSARRLSLLYPARALEMGREGEARLHCMVQDAGRLDCERVSESSSGFGNAALRVARTFRHTTTLADGSDAAGTPVNLRVVFRIADEDNRRQFAAR